MDEKLSQVAERCKNTVSTLAKVTSIKMSLGRKIVKN